MQILKAERAAGDSQLNDIFNREGEPDGIDIRNLNPSGFWTAEIHLTYRKTRNEYVLERTINRPWRLSRIDTLSEAEFATSSGEPDPVNVAEAKVEHDVHDSETEQLRNFIRLHPGGSDIESVYESLKKSAGQDTKGEFETTAEYEARRNSHKSHLPSGLSPGVFAFAFSIGSPSAVGTSTYDADAEVFTIRMPLQRVYPEERSHPALLMKVRGTDRGTYVGSNAMGAKTVVEKNYIHSYLVRIDNDTALPISGAEFSKAIVFDIATPRDKARQVKAHLRGILVCTVAESPVSEGTDYHKPTFTEPHETYFWRHHINCEVRDLLVVDSGTNTILKRVTSIH